MVVFKLICWNWNQESDLPSVPSLCLQELVALPATEQCLSQTKPIIGIYWNGFFFPKVRHKMKFILSHPSFGLKKGVCYHWVLGSNYVTFCLSTSCPCDLPLNKTFCSACTGMAESDPSCLWLLVIQKSLEWGGGNRLSCRIIELDSYLVQMGTDIFWIWG